MEPLLNLDSVSIFHFARYSKIRLNHPEGIMVDPDGNIWCGGEHGELYRISNDGTEIEILAKTDGYHLGLAMDSQRRIYVCDTGHKCVTVFDEKGKELDRLVGSDGDDKLTVPNYVVVDEKRNALYVSNSLENGPGVWRFDLATGASQLWMNEDCLVANGIALSLDGNTLYVVESYLPGVTAVPINEDGSAGPKRLHVSMTEGHVPDGLAVNTKGQLFITCFDPNRIFLVNDKGEAELLVEDKLYSKLNHPTNIALRNDHELFVASLGGWHICLVDLSSLY